MSGIFSIWTLGSYTFPKSLTLIDNIAIEDILADIPLLSIGLLSFGVSTFFLIMKRFTLLPFALHASAIIAFLASIFDLSQLLTRGRYHTSDLPAVAGLIVAREIALSVSIGLRFLFFWLYVAEPPRGETAMPLAHSGTWGRWGFVGLVLKWVLLAVALAISVLQIIWRIVPSANMFGAIYGAESAMEIVASAILLLKLLLNVCITPISPRYKALQNYSAMILALLFNLGVGIGNVITFAFSESILGRFLISVEFYILIVYILISSFYDYAPAKPVGGLGSKAPVENLPESKDKSALDFTTYPRSPVLVAPTLYQNHSYDDHDVSAPVRTPSASRLASWIMPRRESKRRSVGAGDQVQLWDQAERGESPVQNVVSGRDSPYSYKSFVDRPRDSQQQVDAILPIVVDDPGPPAGEELDPGWLTVNESLSLQPNSSDHIPIDTAEIFQPPRMPRNDTDTFASYSIGSYYDGESRRGASPASLPAVVHKVDSPIYGLDGILRRANENREITGSIAPSRSSTTSFTSMSFGELLRQQSELDASIAALRLLSPQLEIPTTLAPPSSEPGTPYVGSVSRTVSSSGMPSSLRSEFSLNDFPEPPLTITVTTNGFPPPTPTSTIKARNSRRNKRRTQDEAENETVIDLSMPRMPVLDNFPTTPQSIPHSPGRSSTEAITNSRTGVDSGGTQYDVTSFIGNLMPTSKKNSTTNQLANTQFEDEGSEFNNSGSTNVPVLPVHPQNAIWHTKPTHLDDSASFLPPDAVAVSYGPATASSGILTARPSFSDEESRMARTVAAQMSRTPLIGSSLSQAIPTAELITNNLLSNLHSSTISYLSAASDGSLGTRRRPPPAGSLPSKPRLTISVPKPALLDNTGNSLSAFEKPRPPPLIFTQTTGGAF